MQSRRHWFLRLVHSDSGATTAEYGIVVTLLAAIALAALLLFQVPLQGLFAGADRNVANAEAYGSSGNGGASSSCGQPPCGGGSAGGGGVGPGGNGPPGKDKGGK